MLRLPAPSTVKEICKAGLPGAIKFTRHDPLSVSMNSQVKKIIIRLPEKGILNVLELKLKTLDKPLPKYKATMSSVHPNAHQDPASLIVGNAGIHTVEEASPWWQVQFDTPVYVQDATIANRDGKWGSRAYSLQLEWTDETGVSWLYDNLGLTRLQERVTAFSNELRLAFTQIHDQNKLSPKQREQLDRCWMGTQDHVLQLQGALSGFKIDLKALNESRKSLLQQIVEIGQSCNPAQLQNLGSLVRISEDLLWIGADGVAIDDVEVDAAAAIFGFIFNDKGSVSLPKTYDMERYLDTEERVVRFELGLQATVEKLGGDTTLFPIQLRAHGLRGSYLRKHETSYVEAVRDVIQKVSAINRPAVLCYGTLLGTIREGRLLAHDDDVDVAFLANSNSEDALRKELEDIILELKANGVKASFESRFLFLKVQAENGILVDAFPIIRTNETTVRMYMEKLKIRDVQADLVLPFASMDFYGQDIAGPANPEGFLADRYGPTWQTPDRFYGLPWTVKRSA